jgi:hypothetical protein
MSLTLIGYKIRTLLDYTERITATFEDGATEYIQVIDIEAPEAIKSSNLNDVRLTTRQSKAFVDTINWLEQFNFGNTTRDTTIFRDLDNDFESACSAMITQQDLGSIDWIARIKSATIRNESEEFWQPVDIILDLKYDAITDSSIETIGYAGTGLTYEWTLAAGDEAREFSLHDGTSWSAIDISPAGATLSCAGKRCRTVNAADLTYTGANGDAFAAAFKQALHNGIYNTYGEASSIYELDVEYQAGVLRVRFMNKHDSEKILYPATPAGAQTTQNGLTRAAVPVVGSGSGFCWVRGESLFASQQLTVNFEADVPCSTLSVSQFLTFSCSGSFTAGQSELSSVTINGSEASQTCDTVRLVVATSCENATYLWDTGETSADKFVDASTSAAHECVVTCVEDSCETTAQTFVTS